MKLRYQNVIGWLLMAAGLFSAWTANAVAQTNHFALVSWSIDSGIGQISGGNFTVNAAVGQPDAGVVSGGSFEVTGGVLGQFESTPSANNQSKVYLPLITR